MKKVFLFGMFVYSSISFSSCNNPASDPNSSTSKQGYDSLSVAGDTVTRHATTFSTAMHQMVNDLNQIPITGNADRDFAILLKSHHQGAVDLAQAELNIGKDDDLKQIAQQIATIQKTEITELDNFVDSIKKSSLSTTYNNNDEKIGFGKVIKTHKTMMWDMAKMDTNMLADQQFAAVMIPHLQSAVYLAKEFLKHGKDAWLIQTAKEIIPRKQRQIEELQEWVNTNKKVQ